MKNLRMPKGWTLVGTNALDFGNTETKAEKNKRFHKFSNLIRNTRSLKLDELIEEGEKAYLEMQKKKAKERARKNKVATTA